MVLLLPLASCSGCCDAECKKVVTVEVVPFKTLAGPNTKLELTAIARDGTGSIIYPTVPVKWEGEPAFDNLALNPTRVTVAGFRTYKVRAKMGKVWSPYASILVEQGSVTSPRDMIEVEHTAGAAPAYVLLDAQAVGDGDCGKANDRQYAVAGRAALPHNLTGSCANEVAVFVRDRAPLVKRLAPADWQWTDGAETMQEVPLPPTLSVPLSIWYFVSDENPQERAGWDLEYAGWIFRQNRVGITLGEVTHNEPAGSKLYDGDAKCTGIEAALGFTAATNMLHVVYVTEIAWNSVPFGLACPSDPTRGDIVIISRGRPLSTTVAHELGHRMGFSNPPFVTTGHVNNLDGFDGTNVMYIHGDAELNEDRVHLTLGQVYRIHADAQSWLNRTPIRPAGSTVKNCPGDAGIGECPKLALRPGSP